jgi:hypothetical protein
VLQVPSHAPGASNCTPPEPGQTLAFAVSCEGKTHIADEGEQPHVGQVIVGGVSAKPGKGAGITAGHVGGVSLDGPTQSRLVAIQPLGAGATHTPVQLPGPSPPPVPASQLDGLLAHGSGLLLQAQARARARARARGCRDRIGLEIILIRSRR